MMDKVIIGTTVKVNVHAEGTPVFDMDDCAFQVIAYCNQQQQQCSQAPINVFGKSYVASKTDCVRVDANNYLVEIPTEEIGRGYVVIRLEIYVPDTECISGYRKEILQELANIQVI